MNIEITKTAADAVRLNFNPSANPEVDYIKTAMASLISVMEGIAKRNDKLAVAEATIAIRHLQTASMWCVFSATKEAPK